MKTLKARFLALCGVTVLLAAALAPTVARAACPELQVECSSGDAHICRGTSNGSGGCTYNESCLNC